MFNDIKHNGNDDMLFLKEQIKKLQEELKTEREHSRNIAEQLLELTKNSQELTRNSQVLLRQEQERKTLLLSDESTSGNLENGTQENKKFFWGFWKKSKK